jgi:ADP-ribose pyrophosphatase
MIRPWPLIASEPAFATRLFRVTRDRARSPRTGGERDFHVIHMVDWLMVVTLTADGKLVLVRQYRHGSRETGLEVPGGLHDGTGERPEQGAVRELTEETGYSSARHELAFLGVLRPQPALLANRAWVYLAKDVRPTAEPEPDAGEDIEVVLLDPREVPARIASGEISNAMTVAALALAEFGGHLAIGKSRQSPEKENGQ